MNQRCDQVGCRHIIMDNKHRNSRVMSLFQPCRQPVHAARFNENSFRVFRNSRLNLRYLFRSIKISIHQLHFIPCCLSDLFKIFCHSDHKLILLVTYCHKHFSGFFFFPFCLFCFLIRTSAGFTCTARKSHHTHRHTYCHCQHLFLHHFSSLKLIF